MRRLVAIVLALTLAEFSTAASPHVHVYLGHDHPDHHHGPATHEHERVLRDHAHSGEAAARIPAARPESCNPGRHAVGARAGVVSVACQQIDGAVLPGPAVGDPSPAMTSALPVTDVRVHGPPNGVRLPSRAPPVAARA